MSAEAQWSISLEDATQTQIWRSLDEWPASARPAQLWAYLSEAGSLTERLRAKAGDLQVQILSQGHAVLSEDDMTLLGAKPDEAGYVRQVFLCGPGREPWVYARSVVAGPAERWLKELGERPLGDKVFANADAERSPIAVAKLEPRHVLHKEAVALLPASQRGAASSALWARRSRLSVGGGHILIYECFLPALIDA
ncbi:MAG TPA: chorismate lyase [Gammaproteobacteria bacterium]|jgi:chorismate--pyruvate lyase